MTSPHKKDLSSVHHDSPQDTPRLFPPASSFRREGEGLEFDRVAFFSDAVFAIAMTLLVVSLTVPELTREQDLPQEMLRALQERQPEILSFFIGFAILGFYWSAHHAFFASLRAVSPRIIRVNLIYLAIVAFLPFPTALIGRYEDNPVAFVLFALVVAAISGLEVVLLRVAFAQDLTKLSVPPQVRRYGVTASAAPVLIFLVSIPIAFWNTSVALYFWLLAIPLGAILRRYAPADTDRYL